MTSTPPRWDEVSPDTWDVYDLVCVLGIEGLQALDVQDLAPRTPRQQPEANGSSGPGPGGKKATVRSRCQFPLWRGHEPQFHQLWTVVTYFSRAYSADDAINKVDRFLLLDDTGLGKTTQMAMVIAYHTWVIEERRKNASFMTPVMRPQKPSILREERALPSIDRHTPVFHPLPALDALKPILIVTKKGIHEQTHGDIFKMLDIDHFSCFRLNCQKNDNDRDDLYRNRLRTSSTRVPVAIASWPSLASEFAFVSKDDSYTDTGTEQEDEEAMRTSHIQPQFERRTAYDVDWSMAFLDEVDDARNPATNTFSNARIITSRASIVFGMTATPVHNTPLDLVNLLRVVGFDTTQRPTVSFPLPEGKLTPKKVKMIQAIMNKRKEISRKRRKALEREGDLTRFDDAEAEVDSEIVNTIMQPLAKFASPLVVRRRADTLAQGRPIFAAPKYSHTEIWVSLSEAHRKLYDGVKGKPFGTEAREVLVDPEVVVENSFPKDSKKVEALEAAASAKVREVIALIQKIIEEDAGLPDKQRRKVILSMHWPRFIPLVLKHLNRAGINAAAMSGRTSDQDRASICQDFQKDGSHRACTVLRDECVVIDKDNRTRVLIITEAASSGLNLHRANIMIMIDQPWTAARRNQIIGRVHRYGQKRRVHVYDVMVQDTIDCRLRSLIERKARYVAVLDENARLISPLLAHPTGPAVASQGDHDQSAQNSQATGSLQSTIGPTSLATEQAGRSPPRRYKRKAASLGGGTEGGTKRRRTNPDE